MDNLFESEKKKKKKSNYSHYSPPHTDNSFINMNGNSNKMVFFTNEHKQPQAMVSSSNQYYSNIPNIFKKNHRSHDGVYQISYSHHHNNINLNHNNSNNTNENIMYQPMSPNNIDFPGNICKMELEKLQFDKEKMGSSLVYINLFFKYF